MPNLIKPCPNCNNRATFSQQRKENEENKKLGTHSALFFNIYGHPVKRHRVLQKYSRYDYFHYVYCTKCTKRRKDLYYSDIYKEIRQFNLPKRPFLLVHFEMYDLYRLYQYRDDRLEMAKKFGYTYISETTAKIYGKLKSVYHTGRLLKLSPYSIRVELEMMGIKRNKLGGWNRGTGKSGRSPDAKEWYQKLIDERLAT